MAIDLVYSFTLALFITIALIPLLIRFSGHLQLLDDPSAERKMHDHVMPRSGGLGIVLGVFVPLVFLLPVNGQLQSLFLGCLIIVFFGLLDDRFELSYQWKLFGQSLAVVLVMSGGVVISQVPFMGLEAAPVWISYPLTFVFLLGIVNGVNFSDGLDGLAAGTTLIALAVIAVLALTTDDQTSAMIALTVAGGILGFLRYNTHPAKIFMGDSGSQFLGFITACLAVIVTQRETSALNPFLPVLLLGIPIMDIIQVVCVRIKKKLPLPGPDKEHFHHQLVKLSFRHYEVVAIIYVLQAVLMTAAYGLRHNGDMDLLLFYGAYFVVVMGIILAAHLMGWKMRAEVPIESGKERRSRILRKIGWYYRYAGQTIGLLMAAFFLLVTYAIVPVKASFQTTALIFSVVMVVGMIVLRKQAAWATRLCCYLCSVMLMFLLLDSGVSDLNVTRLNSYLGVLALMLVLSIRMTRRTDFSLDTQDLLVLLLVVVVPQLPISGIDETAMGSVTLQLAVLLYGCEFVIARLKKQHYILNISAIVSLLIVSFS